MIALLYVYILYKVRKPLNRLFFSSLQLQILLFLNHIFFSFKFFSITMIENLWKFSKSVSKGFWIIFNLKKEGKWFSLAIKTYTKFKGINIHSKNKWFSLNHRQLVVGSLPFTCKLYFFILQKAAIAILSIFQN